MAWGSGVLPEKLGWGVQPASQNPYPIYEQILWFSLPYLWPDQKFDMVLFTAIAAGTVALNIIYAWVLVDCLIDNDEKVASSLLNSMPECKNHTLFLTKMAKIENLFMTRTAEKPYPLAPHIPNRYGSYKGVPHHRV